MSVRVLTARELGRAQKHGRVGGEGRSFLLFLRAMFSARLNSRAVKTRKPIEYPYLSTRNACFAGYHSLIPRHFGARFSLLPSILARLCQISATVMMAVPMLEFLSGRRTVFCTAATEILLLELTGLTAVPCSTNCPVC